MILAAVIFLIIWSASVTLALLALVRQVAVLQLLVDRRRPSSSSLEPFHVDDDGLDIGTSVPRDVSTTLKRLVVSDECAILVMSATCGACREIVDDLKGPAWTRDRSRSLILMIAGREELAGQLADEAAWLQPDGVVFDPEASELSAALGVHSSPFALLLHGETVAGKRYIRNADAVIELLGIGDARPLALPVVDS